MRLIVRRARAAVSLAVLWAAVSAAVGLLVGLGMGVQRSRYPVLPDVGQWWFEWHDLVIGYTTSWAASGALIALAFTVLLRRAERGRVMETLSAARVTRWGALAGGGLFAGSWLVPTQLRGLQVEELGLLLLSLVTATALGAGCAWLTLGLARHSSSGTSAAGTAHAARAGQEALPPGALPEVRPRADRRIEVT
jgi:hypothetical protein